MYARGLPVILMLTLAALACSLMAPPTPAAPAAGETPAPIPAATSLPPPGGETAPATGRAFYVAPYGDNANPGTQERPWATPGYGSRQLQPGDTLIILGGRYVLGQYSDEHHHPTIRHSLRLDYYQRRGGEPPGPGRKG